MIVKTEYMDCCNKVMIAKVSFTLNSHYIQQLKTNNLNSEFSDTLYSVAWNYILVPKMEMSSIGCLLHN